MKNIKYLILGILLTLSGLFVFLNSQPLNINFLFIEVVTHVSTAIGIAFFLGLLSGILIVLLSRSGKKKETIVEEKAQIKMSENEAEEVHGIPLE